MGPPPPLTAELWDALSPPTRAAIRSLIQHYERRLAEFEARTRALEERLDISAGERQEESARAPETERQLAEPVNAPAPEHSGKHERERSHQHRRHRVKVVVNEVKHRRHQRTKLLRLLTRLVVGFFAVVGGLLAAWYFFVRIMAWMTSADGVAE